ncbi:hypothetical protein Tco_0585126 [Tanacetum coccineum]
MNCGFLSLRGRGFKQNKNLNIVSNDVIVGKNVAGSSSMSNNDTASGNKEDTRVATTSTPDVEQVSGTVSVSANDVTKRLVLTKNTKGPQKSAEFRTLLAPSGNGADVDVTKESVGVVVERFSNIVYGFFLGKRVAYPAVENYVKFHDIPITAFTNDGLSAIATKLGTPMMLDSYTAAMYMYSWGRSSYARVMIELRADIRGCCP